MRRSFAAGLVVVVAALLSAGTAQGQISFNGEGFVTFEGNDIFLTLPEIRLGSGAGATELWAKWKLNVGNVSWQIANFGLTSDVPKLGPRTASGRYVFQKGMVVMDITFSNFLGCVIDRGIQVLDVSGITATELTFTIVEPDVTGESTPITCTRSGGAAGDIAGTWQCDLGPVGSLTVDLKQDRTVTIGGLIQNCVLD